MSAVATPQGIEHAHSNIEVVTQHLIKCGESRYEESSTPEELVYLADLAVREQANLIGEVGFNMGVASYTPLSSRPNAYVVSFDIGTHTHISAAKECIDSSCQQYLRAGFVESETQRS